MKPEDQRAAIAEILGGWAWYPIPHLNDQQRVFARSQAEADTVTIGQDTHRFLLEATPNYPEDLNAMRVAESTLSDPQIATYTKILAWICYRRTNHCPWFLLHASAAQRAEAFLRTHGKWRDE